MNPFWLSRARVAISLLAALEVFCTSGCTGDTKAKLQGKVTLDDKPIAAGSITFVPTDGKSQSTKVAIEEGLYTADVPLGSMRVEIHSPKVVGTRKLFDTPDSPVREVFKETIPAQFNGQSKMIHDIKPGNQQLDFALKSSG